MRVKDNGLNLVAHNTEVIDPEGLSTPLESYYHMSSNCSLYNIDGAKFALFLENHDYLFKEGQLQQKHKVTPDDIDRIDRISYQYYGTPELWWLIAQVNDIDPLELYEGQELVIPNIREFDFRTMLKDNFQQSSVV